MRTRQSPQEKKRLSLRRDRRDAYGENDKASRKIIPRAKAHVNRANRRADSVELAAVIGPPDRCAGGLQLGVAKHPRNQSSMSSVPAGL